MCAPTARRCCCCIWSPSLNSCRRAIEPFHGQITWHDPDGIYRPGKLMLTDFAWNHTTLWAIKADDRFTYLQDQFDPERVYDQLAERKARFGDEIVEHIEFMKFGGRLVPQGMTLVRYQSPEQLRELTEFCESIGIWTADPHTHFLDEDARWNGSPSWMPRRPGIPTLCSIRAIYGGFKMPEPMVERQLARLTWTDVAALDKDPGLVILPIGAIEQHGPHLPLITDTLLATHVLDETLVTAPGGGAGVGAAAAQLRQEHRACRLPRHPLALNRDPARGPARHRAQRLRGRLSTARLLQRTRRQHGRAGRRGPRHPRRDRPALLLPAPLALRRSALRDQ